MAVISIKHNDKYEDIILEFGRIFSFLEFQGIPYYEMNWQISCIDI